MDPLKGKLDPVEGILGGKADPGGLPITTLVNGTCPTVIGRAVGLDTTIGPPLGDELTDQPQLQSLGQPLGHDVELGKYGGRPVGVGRKFGLLVDGLEQRYGFKTLLDKRTQYLSQVVTFKKF